MGYLLDKALTEIEQLSLDEEALMRAKNLLMDRLMAQEHLNREVPFHKTAAALTTAGVMELALDSVRQSLAEYKAALPEVQIKDKANERRAHLQVIGGLDVDGPSTSGPEGSEFSGRMDNSVNVEPAVARGDREGLGQGDRLPVEGDVQALPKRLVPPDLEAVHGQGDIP